MPQVFHHEALLRARLDLNLTQEQLWRASARMVPVNGQMAPNPFKRWRQIDASLPDTEIVIYGPAANHGTRDARQ